MSDKGIWIVFTKSKALEGCPINIDGCDFYFAEAFVPVDRNEGEVDNIEQVIERTKQALLTEKLDLNDISKCIRYKEVEWSEGTNLNDEIRATADKALQTNEVEFNVFRSKEIQEDCVYTFQAFEAG